MPINHPYDPRYNAKLYIPKLTEEERRARATPLENLRGLRFRTATPAAPAALPTPPQFATAEIATPQNPTPEAPTVEAPTAELPTPEVPTPEPAAQEDPAPDHVPAAWEVVFAQFPELYPEHAERVCAAASAPEAVRAPRSHAPWRTGLPPASSQRRAAHWVVLSSTADGPIHAEPGPPTEIDRHTRWTESRRRACRGAPRP